MLTYLLQLTLIWTLLAVLFHTLLRRQTYFGANRLYLLAGAFGGVLLPLLADWLAPVTSGLAITGVLPEFRTGLAEAGRQTPAFSLWPAIRALYVVGVLVAMARIGYGLYRIIALWRERESATPDGIVRSRSVHMPFSFFRWIFVPVDYEREDPDFEGMLAHERAHAAAWHSADVLLMEMLCAVLWFHPLAHWFRRTLRTVHEYQADAYAASRVKRRQYGELLLRQSLAPLPLSLANHFFQSPLKQRLRMLVRRPSGAWSRTRYLTVLPLLVVSMWFCAPEPPAPAHAASQTLAAEYPGGINALMTYLGQNVQYPQEARDAAQEGIAQVAFVVQTDGAIGEVEVLNAAAIHTSLAAEAVRVVRSMPAWKPGVQDGKPVSTKLTLPIRFKLE